MAYRTVAGPISICNCRDHAWQSIGRGHVTLVSTPDRHLLEDHAWHSTTAGHGHGSVYAECRRPRLMLHQIICGKHCDHKNRNGLDNRRTNLRPANRYQQAANTVRKRKCKTIFRGTRQRGNIFQSNIKFRGKLLYLGSFKTPKDAALAYDKKARELYGEFAVLNFP